MIRESSSREVKSVRTGFRIIDILQNHDGAQLDELADRIGLAKSTVHNYLATLESMGYVVERDRTYHLGLRFLTHGMAAKSGLRIEPAVEASLSGLAAETDLPAWWIAEEHGRGLFVGSTIPEDGSALYGRVGKRSHLHTHAAGKAILASMSEEEVRAVADYHGLPAHTDRTTTDVDALVAELAGIREQGYAVCDGEAALGVRSVGVAFEGPDGARHAVAVFGHAPRVGTPPSAELTEALTDAADEIASAVGGER